MKMINSGGLEGVRVIKSVKVSSSDDSNAKQAKANDLK